MTMELDMTFLAEEDCSLLSGSVAELGKDAGSFTWNNCLKLAEAHMNLLDHETQDVRQEIRDHFREYGAWDKEEIDGWSDRALVALVIQEAAASIREIEHFDTLDEWRVACDAGRVSGRLYITDSDNHYYLMIG